MAVTMLFGGCGAPTVAPPAETSASASRAHGASNSDTLIWTIDGYVYAYTLTGQQSEVLSGFSAPVGLCSDPSGDIYVVDAARQLVYVYAPGESLPFYIYDDLSETPSSCAFDPTTGDLAVANAANVTVFPPDSGEPLVYKDQKMASYAFLGYDKSGNLYIDGFPNGGGRRGFALAELPAGGSALTDIQVSNLSHGRHYSGGLVWDGEDLAVADWYNKVIYRIAISGSSGEILNTYHIWKWHHRYDPVFALDGKQLYFPGKGAVEFFPYPPKGRPRNGFYGHIGGALVIAPEVVN